MTRMSSIGTSNRRICCLITRYCLSNLLCFRYVFTFGGGCTNLYPLYFNTILFNVGIYKKYIFFVDTVSSINLQLSLNRNIFQCELNNYRLRDCHCNNCMYEICEIGALNLLQFTNMSILAVGNNVL